MVDFKTFVSDWSEFRKKLGEKSFWRLDPIERDRWFHGLGWCYIMLKPETPQENERAIMIMNSIVDEYARRNAYVLLHPIPAE